MLKINPELLPAPQVPEGKVVVLSFRFIDLESDNLCRYDYVDVYSGHVNGQRLGRFCGTFKPGALVSTGSKMLLQMVSDANTAGSGFLAVFSAAHPHERGRKKHVHCCAKDCRAAGGCGEITHPAPNPPTCGVVSAVTSPPEVIQDRRAFKKQINTEVGALCHNAWRARETKI